MRAGENKKTAFKRLAKKRTNRLIRDLRLIGNLSNKNNYSFTERDFKSIFKIIEEEMRLAKSRFQVSLSKGRKKEFRI